MLRLGLITHGMATGGIERSIARIAHALNRDDFQSVVICLSKSGPAADWLPSDVPVIEINKRSGNDLFAVIRLASELQRHQLNIVQSHNWGTLIETVLARKIARVPFHIHAERGTVMGVTEGGRQASRMRSFAMRTALRTVDQVMSNSHAVASRVELLSGYPATKVRVIANGVPELPLENRERERLLVRKTLGVDPNSTLIGSVGRLHSVKGFDTLLRAFGLMQPKQNNLHLVIAGDGEQRRNLEAIAKELRVADRVHLVGHQENVTKWLLGLDIYVNSSRSEGMSQSMAEAMSAGLPIIATDVGDAKRMIARKDLTAGIVCPKDDVVKLSNAMGRLLDDREDLQRCGANALACHQRYYSDLAFAESIDALYRNAIGEPIASVAAANRAESAGRAVEDGTTQVPVSDLSRKQVKINRTGIAGADPK